MIKSSEIEINGQTLHIETGRIAKQASGSAVVTYGETVVLVTVVSTDDVREGVDFLPLSVEYKEMSYAGGRFPGNYFRRDMGKPGEKETLTARLIDRPIRPLFPENFKKELIALIFKKSNFFFYYFIKNNIPRERSVNVFIISWLYVEKKMWHRDLRCANILSP